MKTTYSGNPHRLAAVALGAFLIAAPTKAEMPVIAERTSPEPPPAPMRTMPESFASVVARARPAVVNVSARQSLPSEASAPESPLDPTVPRVPGIHRQRSLGSGLVIDSRGLIVTNAHVVSNAEEVIVRLPQDGLADHERELPADIVGIDSRTDLALIRIQPGREIPSLALRDAPTPRVGDWIVAIGNPFGLSQTVTAGIVSATGRVLGEGSHDEYIQTDASINPGSSGGPLLDVNGNVVGISVAIVTDGGGNLGIGFGTPVQTARPVIEELRRHGRVVRGWLGVTTQDVTPELGQAFQAPPEGGALVSEVVAGGPAERAGIRRGDVVRRFDGKPVASARELSGKIADMPVGRVVEAQVLRKGGEERLQVRIAEMPGPDLRAAAGEEGEDDGRLGLAVEPVQKELARDLGLTDASGLLVITVEPGTIAEDAGLIPGDVILEVNGTAVRSVVDLRRAARAPSREVIVFFARRDGEAVFLATRKEPEGPAS